MPDSSRSALLTLFLLLAGFARPILAQSETGIDLHGYLLGDFAARTTGDRPPDGEGGKFLLAEERVRLDLNAWADAIRASARIKGDFWHDAVARKVDLDLREAYLDYAAGVFDFRLGRQVATWGVGDLLFINDVFPKDWGAFLSGRPMEYLKVGVDGLRARFSSGGLNAEFLAIPFFTPDEIPSSRRFLFFDPMAAIGPREEKKPRRTLDKAELALRLYRRVGDFDVSAYAYRGYWRTPSLRPEPTALPIRVTAFYPDLSVYGLSAQGNALGGVLSLEGGYYHSRKDASGEDPAVPNSQARFLIGYQRQPWEDFTVGLQYYAEIMEDYGAYRDTLPPGFPPQKKYRDVVTFRVEQWLRHQTWRLSLFVSHGRAERDTLVQPQVSYKVADDLTITLGANLFGGAKETTSLGQFKSDENVYLIVRFDF